MAQPSQRPATIKKGLLEECDKEENMEVNGAATTSRLKRITQ